MPYIPMPDLSDNSFIEFSATLNAKSYTFIVRWNKYCNCAFARIKYNNKDLLDGEYPLVCNGIIDIDHRELPKLVFGHRYGTELPPTKETFNEYGLFYAK